MGMVFLDNWPRVSILVNEILGNDTCMDKGNNTQLNNLEFFILLNEYLSTIWVDLNFQNGCSMVVPFLLFLSPLDNTIHEIILSHTELTNRMQKCDTIGSRTSSIYK